MSERFPTRRRDRLAGHLLCGAGLLALAASAVGTVVTR